VVPVDPRGEFLSTVKIPADAAVGPHLVTATQRLIDDTEVTPGQLSIDVVADEAAATVSDGRPVPSEVEDDPPEWLAPTLLGVAALLALGLVFSRRRRVTTTANG
jgi:MYXO-CTERM domain-containing protein